METAITTVIRRARAWGLGMMCRGASYSCSLSPGRRMWPGVMYWGVTSWVIFGQTSNTWYLRSKKRFRLGLRFPACWDDCAHCGMLARTPGCMVREIRILGFCLKLTCVTTSSNSWDICILCSFKHMIWWIVCMNMHEQWWYGPGGTYLCCYLISGSEMASEIFLTWDVWNIWNKIHIAS